MLLLAMALTVAGCTPVRAAFNQPKRPVITKEATVGAPAAAIEGTLPSGLPETLPLWPGGTVTDSAVDEEGSISLMIETTDDYAVVMPGMSVGLERAGWQVSEGLKEGDSTVLDIVSAGFTGVITITRLEAGGTTVDYFLTSVGT